VITRMLAAGSEQGYRGMWRLSCIKAAIRCAAIAARVWPLDLVMAALGGS